MPNDTLDNVIGYDNPVTYFISINTRDSMSQKNTLKGVFMCPRRLFDLGYCPVYFKSIQEVPAEEILTHRILWSFFFMLLLMSITRHWPPFTPTCSSPKSTNVSTLLR